VQYFEELEKYNVLRGSFLEKTGPGLEILRGLRDIVRDMLGVEQISAYHGRSPSTYSVESSSRSSRIRIASSWLLGPACAG
jgi:hypothetical protein